MNSPFFNSASIRDALDLIDFERESLKFVGDMKLNSVPFRITGNVFRHLLGPCVYVAIRDDVAIYVGRSNRGLSRISNRQHQVSGPMETCDKVLLYPCQSNHDAIELETKLIRILKPEYNRTIKST